MNKSRTLMLVLALSLAVVAGIVRAARPEVAVSQASAMVAQAPAPQQGVQDQSAQGGPLEAIEPNEPAGDTDNLQVGDQTGPDTPEATEPNEPAGPDTDNLQEGDQGGPDDGSEGPEDPAK